MAIIKRTVLALTIAAATMNAQEIIQEDAIQGNSTFGPLDVVGVFAGIMDGILHTDRLDYLLSCMNGTESLVTDVENMVIHFKEGGAIGIGQGIMDIGKFLQDLPPTVYYCGSIPEDLSKLAKFISIFGDPAALSERITYNLLWYYSDINGSIQAAIKNWDNGLYYDFGKELGNALVQAIGDHSAISPIPDQVHIPKAFLH